MSGAHFTLVHTGESCAIVAIIRHHLTIPGSLMAHIELPRALEDYFAFAETAPTRNGRRFVLSLPYFCGSGTSAKLDRLQWWFHVSPAQERQMGEAAVATLRAQATERFRRHIERWLQNTRQRLHGEDPIPRIEPVVATALSVETSSPSSSQAAAAASSHSRETPRETTAEVVPWPAERVANG
jgi:hypothetical protein